VVDALGEGKLAEAPVTPQERVLLELVEQVTRHAWRTNAPDIERVRAAGYDDPQIAEAIYITALFAFFNRVADAFGLSDPGYRQMLAAGLPLPAPSQPPEPTS